MNSTGWIEKYRPKSLKEVIGQDKAVKELAKRIKEGTLRQNILFSGPSGIGKTTIARIIAKTINCKSPMIDHLDGVEHFSPCLECSACKAGEAEESTGDFHFYSGAELGKDGLLSISSLCNAPPMYGKARIIFIDEIQVISSGKDSSIQTLLKIIERDYKGKVYFILSTMEPKKINKAVIDRCSQHFKLKNVSPPDLISMAQKILMEERLLEDIDFQQIQFYKEGIPVFLREGLEVIATSSEGCVRKFIGYLETCIYRELYTQEEILNELQIISPFQAVALIKMLLKKDKDFFSAIYEYDNSMEEFFNLSYSIITDLCMFIYTGKVRMAWQEGQFTPFKGYKDETRELLEAYTKIWNELQGYFKTQVYISNILFYMNGSSRSNGKVLLAETKEETPKVEEVPRRRRRGE